MTPQRDSSAILNAIIQRLGSDATLLALMPNGVYEDLAPAGSTRFVIVSQETADDEPVYLGALEHHWITVEARSLSSANGDVRGAAVRIDTLLEPQAPELPGLTIPGYTLVGIIREEPLRHREFDEVDKSIQWVRRGHRYRIDVAREWAAAG